jgi:hypothetical protein
MGILQNSAATKPATSSKRKSGIDFSKLQPLKSSSTVKNFTGYRDANAAKNSVLRNLEKKGKKDDDEMDSEGDEDDEVDYEEKMPRDDEATDNTNGKLLSPEDAARQENLAEGLKKINLVCRIVFFDVRFMLIPSPAQAPALYRASVCAIAIHISVTEISIPNRP